MYNGEYLDIFEKINSLAKNKGYYNGVDWAREAAKKGIISASQCRAFENCHRLRNSLAHGNAADISITAETYGTAVDFYNALLGKESIQVEELVEKEKESVKIENIKLHEVKEKHISKEVYIREKDRIGSAIYNLRKSLLEKASSMHVDEKKQKVARLGLMGGVKTVKDLDEALVEGIILSLSEAEFKKLVSKKQ